MNDFNQRTSSISASVRVWDAPKFASLQPVKQEHGQEVRYRLFHVSEISEGKAAAYRLAMANVMSGVEHPLYRAIYLLSGTPSGVNLYIGIAHNVTNTSTYSELNEMANSLKSSFEGNFLGAKLEDATNHHSVKEMESSVKHLGLISGVPSFNEEENHADDEDFQGIERLANSMVGETWQLVIVSEPGEDAHIRDTLDRIYDFSTDISQRLKQSVQRSENTGFSNSETVSKSTSHTTGTNEGDTRGNSESGTETDSKNYSSSNSTKSTATNVGISTSHATGSNKSDTTGDSFSKALGKTGGQSLSYTSERTDKRVEEVQKHLSENLIPRFQQGRSKGMFRTAIYVCAKEASTYDRLARNFLSIFQGNAATMTPLRVEKLTDDRKQKGLPLQIHQHTSREALHSVSPLANLCSVHSVPCHPEQNRIEFATWFTTRELALVAGLPSKELPGLKIRKSVDFALNTPTKGSTSGVTLKLGSVVQHGRTLDNSPVSLPIADLNKHVFVTGVTGAGKTTTCMKLLMESGLPFMVIEPAKTEYRALHSQDKSIEFYVPGREDLTPFRLNPFELVSKHENLAGHISMLNATLGAVFPMEASMPYLVEEAIIKAYQNKGWDVHGNTNMLVDDPWATGAESGAAWPTFGDMIALLDDIIKGKGMGKEFEEKYRGSLVSRLTNLTLGTKGRMLNTRHSLNFDALLDKKVVIELDELKDEQDKALFMGLILNRLAECMKHRHRKQPTFRHLTLIEEAHRLLTRPEPGDPGSKKLGVETFANLLSEVRKYGEGLIIADQIPNKLVSDVIKNTHTKIVHRLFSADDRNTIGDAMGLSDEQKDFLPLLQTGETIVYCGGWHAAVRVQVAQSTDTSGNDLSEDLIQAQGAAQIWAQRGRLYPELSAQAAMANANGAALGRFATEGVALLNVMLAVKQKRDDSKQAEFVERVQSRYAKNYQHLKTNLPQLAQLLTALFLDVSGLHFSVKTKALFIKALPAVLESLVVDVAAFKTCIKEREPRALLDDPQFKGLQSI